jgi:hypothetical protein
MKLWKCVALVAAGGVLLQVGGCAMALVEYVGQLVITQGVSAFVSALLGASATT